MPEFQRQVYFVIMIEKPVRRYTLLSFSNVSYNAIEIVSKRLKLARYIQLHKEEAFSLTLEWKVTEVKTMALRHIDKFLEFADRKM